MMKDTIIISLSVGWAIRNYFYTGVVSELTKKYNVVVVTTRELKKRIMNDRLIEGMVIETYEERREPLGWRLLRQLKKKIYMESRRCDTEAIWEKYKSRPLYQKCGSALIKIFHKIIDMRKLLAIVERFDQLANRCSDYDEMFDRHKPTLLFCTHATSYLDESVMRNAVCRNIPAVFMVLSWDHVSSKVILGNQYQKILVWNEIMKQEILDTYPYYTDDDIRVVGIPQYDIYNNRPEISYDQWCAKYALSPEKRTITFYTMPQVRHGEQHLIIGQIADALKTGVIDCDNVQVLIKCHPFDDVSLYESLVGRGGVGICKTTLPAATNAHEWYPGEDELVTSRDCLFYSDITINIFSTVTLEAALFNKPIINIGYDITEPRDRIPCKEYYHFAHFRNIMTYDATRFVESGTDLVKAINEYLNDPGLHSEGRRRLVADYFGSIDGCSYRRVADNVCI